jgi:hypothetical protein
MITHITVFGGSQPKPGESVFEEALHLGKILAQKGYIVLTGGYIGTMEAVSRGASEAGGHVIGVTCDQIEAWRPVKANPWITEEWHFSTLQERLFALIHHGDAYLALPGGVGTATELMLTWNLLITHVLPPRPLITIGTSWQRFIQNFMDEQDEFIPEIQRQCISCVPNVDHAVNILQELQLKL